MAVVYLATHRRPCHICTLSLGFHISVSLLNEIRQPPPRLAEVHMQNQSTGVISIVTRMVTRLVAPCELPVSCPGLPWSTESSRMIQTELSHSWASESSLCSGVLAAHERGHWSTTHSDISVCICAARVDGAAQGSALAAQTRFQQRQVTGLRKSNQLYQRNGGGRSRQTGSAPRGSEAIGAGTCVWRTEEGSEGNMSTSRESWGHGFFHSWHTNGSADLRWKKLYLQYKNCTSFPVHNAINKEIKHLSACCCRKTINDQMVWCCIINLLRFVSSNLT